MMMMVSFEGKKQIFKIFLYLLESMKLASLHTKKDDTVDMRYAESREAVASGLISKDEKIGGKIQF